MVRDQQSKATPHAVLGVFIALLGIVLTLDNLGLADTGSLIRFWPALPIAVGVIMLMHADTAREWVFGTAWMTAGGLLLARNLGWLSFQLRDFLPLLLVAVGVRLIWRDRQRATPQPPAGPAWEAEPLDVESPELEPRQGDVAPPIPPPPIPPIPPIPPSASSSSSSSRVRTEPSSDWDEQRGTPWGAWCDWRASGFTSRGRTPWQHWESWQSWRGRHWAPRRGHVRMLALMSGVERRIRAEGFTGAELTAIMGACELDLRHAQMAGMEAHISGFALWGGIEIRVPEHWVVVNRSMAFMGGVEDTTRHVLSPERPRLYIHGFALMAGIEIKN